MSKKPKPPRWWWLQKKRELKEKHPNKADQDLNQAVGHIWYHIYTDEKREAILQGKQFKKKPICPGRVFEVTETEDYVLVPLIPIGRSFSEHLILTIAYDLMKLGYSLTEIREHYPSLMRIKRANIINYIEHYGRVVLTEKFWKEGFFLQDEELYRIVPVKSPSISLGWQL